MRRELGEGKLPRPMARAHPGNCSTWAVAVGSKSVDWTAAPAADQYRTVLPGFRRLHSTSFTCTSIAAVLLLQAIISQPSTRRAVQVRCCCAGDAEGTTFSAQRLAPATARSHPSKPPPAGHTHPIAAAAAATPAPLRRRRPPPAARRCGPAGPAVHTQLGTDPSDTPPPQRAPARPPCAAGSRRRRLAGSRRRRAARCVQTKDC